MYNAERANTALKKLENFDLYFMGPVGSMEGPSRVPLNIFCCLKCKNIANIANFHWWPYLTPPGLIKDSQTLALCEFKLSVNLFLKFSFKLFLILLLLLSLMLFLMMCLMLSLMMVITLDWFT